MREADNIRAVEALGIDWMGFIFWPRSSRYVSEPPAYLPTRCRRVGVFVDADVDDILRHIGDYTLDVVQLHGHESAAHLRALRTQVPVPDGESSGLTLIKAFNIATPADLDQTADYDGKGTAPEATASSSTGACSTTTTATRPSCSAAA